METTLTAESLLLQFDPKIRPNIVDDHVGPDGRVNLDSLNSQGYTLLMRLICGSKHPSPSIFRYILAHQSRPLNHENVYYLTSLHLALFKQDTPLPVVSLLLEYGADTRGLESELCTFVSRHKSKVSRAEYLDLL